MFSKPRLAATRARKLLAYDPETGALTWKASRGCAKPGKEAGTVWTNGRNSYRHVGIDGSYYLAHRLCFLIYYGAWPAGDIDHLDQNGLNNRIANFRAATRAINTRNRRKNRNNTSGVGGVNWHRGHCKWQACIHDDSGRRIHLGTFDSLAAAAEMRKLAERRHGYHENHGRQLRQERETEAKAA